MICTAIILPDYTPGPGPVPPPPPHHPSPLKLYITGISGMRYLTWLHGRDRVEANDEVWGEACIFYLNLKPQTLLSETSCNIILFVFLNCSASQELLHIYDLGFYKRFFTSRGNFCTIVFISVSSGRNEYYNLKSSNIFQICSMWSSGLAGQNCAPPAEFPASNNC